MTVGIKDADQFAADDCQTSWARCRYGADSVYALFPRCHRPMRLLMLMQALKMLANFQQTTRRPAGPIATMERTQSVQKRLHPHLNLNRRAVESMSIPTIGPEILVAGIDGNLQEVGPAHTLMSKSGQEKSMRCL